MRLAASWGECKTYGRDGGVGRRGDHTGESRAAPAIASRYNRAMQIGVFFIRVLEVMFFVGLAGSAVVVLISFLEDAKELFGKD